MIAFLNKLGQVTNLRTLAMIGACMALTLAVTGFVLIIWLGGLPEGSAGDRLDYIAIITIIFAGAVIVGQLSLAGMRLAGKGPGGLSVDLSADDHDDQKSPAVVTTTKTEIKP